MSSSVASPPPASEKSGKRRRGGLPWLSPKPETRSVQIGVLATILIHVIIFALAPYILDLNAARSKGIRAPAKAKPITIELTEDMFKSHTPPPKPPMKFVEANPNAPENVPDKTNNFSDRNQQVAQEKAVKDHSDMPTIKGQTEIKSPQIVTGRLEKPQEAVPEATPPPSAMKPPSAAAPKRAENPLKGFEKKQGEAADGFAANTSKDQDNTKLIPEQIKGAKDAPLIENSTATVPQIDPRHPQARRTLDHNVRPAIFTEHAGGTSNIGPIAVDSRWSNYGVYLKKLIETVQIEWDAILEASHIYPNSGAQVQIKFILDKKGDVKIVHVETTPGAGDPAEQACVSALTDRAPYGDWTDDMISVLGEKQEMTFGFYYQ